MVRQQILVRKTILVQKILSLTQAEHFKTLSCLYGHLFVWFPVCLFFYLFVYRVFCGSYFLMSWHTCVLLCENQSIIYDWFCITQSTNKFPIPAHTNTVDPDTLILFSRGWGGHIWASSFSLLFSQSNLMTILRMVC